MTRTEFVRLVGDTVSHVTRAENIGHIRRRGLRAAATLARDAGQDPADLCLRTERRALSGPGWSALLNHQRPLCMGRNRDFLDGHTLTSWAAQLDRRIFFWPARSGRAFSASLDGDICYLTLDAGRLFDAFASDLFLSPINSGNAARRPALRGDWLYVPVSCSVDAFCHNRRGRTSKRARDRVAEVSVFGPVPPQVLSDLEVS